MRVLGILGAAIASVVMTGCSGRAVPDPQPAPNPPHERIAFMVLTHGGRIPSALSAMESPELVIYGDGRALTIVEDTAAQIVPARYRVSHLDPAAVSSFLSDARKRGVISAGTDFGTPRVADGPTTTVLLDGPDGPTQVDPYALAEQFDRGLTDSQRDARTAVRSIIDQAKRLSAGAARTPYSPARIAVYEIATRPGEPAATTNWPGPPPTFLRPGEDRRWIACGELSGDPARVVYEAALDNPGASWLIAGATRVLAVNALPLAGSCS